MNLASRLALLVGGLLWAGAASAQEHHHEAPPAPQAPTTGPTQSEREHVPPDPPSSEMPDMSYDTMAELMTMDDTAPVGKVLFDQLDWRDAQRADTLAWDAHAHYGSDSSKLWLKSEGERASGATHEARAEVLWDRIFSRWWSTQVGLRHDFGAGPSRDWLAAGVQGLAPCFFEIEAAAYFGDAGRTAARFKVEYELLFTQRLVLQPELELNAYGKDDPENRIMSGFSDAQLALRLRYEIRRELAPYIGIAWVRRLGKTADLARSSGEDPSDLQAVAGIRFWF
jgi:copper resistance protein B